MVKYIEANGIVFTLDGFLRTWEGYDKKIGRINETEQEQEYIETWFVGIQYKTEHQILLIVDSEEERDGLLKEVNKKILEANE